MTTRTKPPTRWIDPPGIFHWAHRGAGHEGPPNTIFAMKRALDNGADGLEIDVHCTVDGVLVVCHDPTVDDTTDVMVAAPGAITTAIAGMTYDQLKRLDAAHWWRPGALSDHGESGLPYSLRGRAARDPSLRIPTLAEVIGTFPGVPLNIDLKLPGYERQLADQLKTTGADRRSIVASFGNSVVEYRRLSPGSATSANRRELISFAAKVLTGRRPCVPFVAAQIPVLPNAVLRRFVSGAHECGVAVHVWTVDDSNTAKTLAAAHVDGIMTNRSTMLTPVLTEMGVRWNREITAEIGLHGPFR